MLFSDAFDTFLLTPHLRTWSWCAIFVWALSNSPRCKCITRSTSVYKYRRRCGIRAWHMKLSVTTQNAYGKRRTGATEYTDEGRKREKKGREERKNRRSNRSGDVSYVGSRAGGERQKCASPLMPLRRSYAARMVTPVALVSHTSSHLHTLHLRLHVGTFDARRLRAGLIRASREFPTER